MKAKAVRLHAANDLRLEEFELPEIKDDEILVKVISDSICMSTYKCAILGTKHKRVHEDVAEHPAIMGHEFAGDIVKVGAKHADKFKPGMKFTLQPALNYKGTMWSPGYSYEFFGGDATYCIISAKLNFYDVHYNSTHVIGTTGGNTADMIESLELSAAGRINPAVMVTHIGGLDAAADTTLNLPKIPGGKKLIYTHITMPLTAIDDFRAKGAEDARFTALADIVDAHDGLWCAEAEEYLLANWVEE